MSTEIVIFEDGKMGRGSKARLIKRGHKRVLIEFTKYDYEKSLDVVVTEWFKLFIPPWSSSKNEHKHNNKRKYAKYCHSESNEFYSDRYQSTEFKDSFLEHRPEEFEMLFK